jgi:hypothetical protein
MGFSSLRFLFLVLVVALLAVPALADGSHDRTQFGHDISIGVDEQASDVTCFGCSVRIHGLVDGDVTTFGGSITVERDGTVGGDVTAFGGDLRLDAGATVNEVTVFGGQLRRDSQASVGGDVARFGGGAALWLFLIFGLPFLILGAFITLIVWLIRRFSRPALPVTARV